MLQPLGNRVVVKPDEPKAETASGFIVPKESAERPDRGEVVAVGPGRRLDNGEVVEMVVAVGSTVVYGKGCGIEIEEDDQTYVVLTEEEIIGTIV